MQPSEVKNVKPLSESVTGHTYISEFEPIKTHPAAILVASSKLSKVISGFIYVFFICSPSLYMLVSISTSFLKNSIIFLNKPISFSKNDNVSSLSASVTVTVITAGAEPSV